MYKMIIDDVCIILYIVIHKMIQLVGFAINPFLPTVPTFAVRETASLGIMGEPRVPPLNPLESIVL